MIKIVRTVDACLRPLGFQPGIYAKSMSSASFWRRSANFDLFERVDLVGFGDCDSNVGADLGISIMPGLAGWGNFAEFKELLYPDRGRLLHSVVLQDSTRLAEWSRWLVEQVIGEMPSLVQEHGEDLLNRSRFVRSVAEGCLASIPSDTRGEPLVELLVAKSTPEQLAKAKAFLRVGLITIDGARRIWDKAFYAYRAAAIALVHLSPGSDLTKLGFSSQDAYQDEQLAQTLQIVASRLYPEPGWQDLDGVDSSRLAD